jgi:NADPH:quinone reductase-like Zn-dependent oxidoreductase
MRAMVYTEFGPPDVLKLKQVEKPAPNDREILVRVHATPVGYGDIITRNFRNSFPHRFNMPFLFWLLALTEFGFRKPKRQILGAEFAGVIEATGPEVTRFKTGDPVFGYRGSQMGANAEYLCMPEAGMVAIKPANMSYEEAATIPYGALTALNLLRKVNVRPGHKVLINGASGGIGSAAVQLAKHFGAEVTGVCGTPRVEFVKALGADTVIDYTQEDFTQRGETYDLIFDILGKSSFARCQPVLNPDGVYLLASFKMKHLFQMLWTSLSGDKRVICALSMEKPEDLLVVKELVEAGKLTSVIDRRYALEETVEAHRYVEAGLKQGHVVITM